MRCVGIARFTWGNTKPVLSAGTWSAISVDFVPKTASAVDTDSWSAISLDLVVTVCARSKYVVLRSEFKDLVLRTPYQVLRTWFAARA